MILSAPLRDALSDRLERAEQAIVLLNRRGYATVVFCRQCGETLECPNCSVSLTVHKAAGRARCHYCNFARPLPKMCAQVRRASTSSRSGFGTERVEAEVRALPARRASRRASIATPIRRRGAIAAMLATLRERGARRPRRHADDREGARFSARDAGRRHPRRRRPRAGGLPRRRTDVPVADAGRGPRGTRRDRRRSDRADAVSEPLQHPPRVPAGLRRVLRRRAEVPAGDAVSAGGRADQRRRQGAHATGSDGRRGR